MTRSTQLVCGSCGEDKPRPGVGYPCPACATSEVTWIPRGVYQRHQRATQRDPDSLITGTPSWVQEPDAPPDAPVPDAPDVPPEPTASLPSAEGAPPEGPPEASLDPGRRPGETTSHRGGCTRRDRGPPDGSRRLQIAEDKAPDWYDGLFIPPCADGELFHLMCQGCGYIHIVPKRCKRRTCASCAHAKFKAMMAKYGPLSRGTDYPKLLTLTLKRGETPGQMVSWILDCFQRLRRREIWQHQKGGAYFLEGKPPEDGEGWNVHLHVLVDGPPMPQAILSKEWLDLTESSFVVDIRKVSKTGGLGYALGYCLEGSKVAAVWGDATDAQREAWEAAVKHRRLVQTFGDWHGAAEPDDQGKTCPNCGKTSWAILEFLGRGGHELAQHMGLNLWEVPTASKPPPQRKLSIN